MCKFLLSPACPCTCARTHIYTHMHTRMAFPLRTDHPPPSPSTWVPQDPPVGTMSPWVQALTASPEMPHVNVTTIGNQASEILAQTGCALESMSYEFKGCHGIHFLLGALEIKKGNLQQKLVNQPWFQAAPLLNSKGHAAVFERLFYCFKSNNVGFLTHRQRNPHENHRKKCPRKSIVINSAWWNWGCLYFFLVLFARDLLEVFYFS